MYQVIAIDGPSASGKGTIASRVANALGWAYLDSGALYRVSALYAKQNGVDISDEKSVSQLVRNMPVSFLDGQVRLNNQDVSLDIRSEEIGMLASRIAALPEVRQALLQLQRDFAVKSPVVADGRDMASVVFPEAQLKVFLQADAHIRALRRAKQLGLASDGEQFEKILHDIEKRDYADYNRAVSPLVKVESAYTLDTSNITIEEAVKKVIEWYQQVKK